MDGYGRTLKSCGRHSLIRDRCSSEATKKGTMPTTLNERLDEMGPRYRGIFGRLTRVLAVIENAASKKPPRMTSAQFEMTIELLESSATELTEAAKSPRIDRPKSSGPPISGC